MKRGYEPKGRDISASNARWHFLEAIEKLAPEVVKELENVLPFLTQHNLHLLKLGQLWLLIEPLFASDFARLTCEQAVARCQRGCPAADLLKGRVKGLEPKFQEDFFDSVFPGLIEIRDGLQGWANTHRLAANGLYVKWTIETACQSLQHWARGQNKELFVANKTAYGLFDGPPPLEFHFEAWDPFKINEDSYKARARQAFDIELKNYLHQWQGIVTRSDAGFGLIPALNKTQDAHYEWLALYQCKGMTMTAIGNSFGRSREAVKEAIRDAAELLEMTEILRPPDRGGRKKGSKDKNPGPRIRNSKSKK